MPNSLYSVPVFVAVGICTLYFSGGCGSARIQVNPPTKPLPVVKTELRLKALPGAGNVIAHFPVKEQFHWEVSVPDVDPQESALQVDLESPGFELGEMHAAMERIPNSTIFRTRMTPLTRAADISVKLTLIHFPDAKQRVVGSFSIQAASDNGR